MSLYTAPFNPPLFTCYLMSKALFYSSHRSQGSLGPEDSISQVLPPYFSDNFRLDIDLENESSTHINSLSLAPSGLLTPTFGPNSSRENLLVRENSTTIAGDISGMHLNVPHAFLPKCKARKGLCWLPSNGMEVLEKGKWHRRCARCMFILLCINYYNTGFH